MYAVDERVISINGEPFFAYSRNVNVGETSLTVEVGTTGFTDSDETKDDPTRTVLRLMCNDGDFCFRLINKDGETIGATIMTCGKEGLQSLINAIQFAAKVYHDQCLEIDE